MTAVPCPHCEVTCAGPQGLASHIRSMHRDATTAATAPKPPTGGEAPPEPAAGQLVWEDPPKRGRPATTIPAVLKLIPTLRSNPGRWARLHTFKGATSAGTLRKRITELPDVADIEFSSHKVGTGSALYGRYTGK